jgi:hypothetical protein
MGIKRSDWDTISEYVSKIKSEGLSYVEGAKRFGLDVSDIYNYNKKKKNHPCRRGLKKVKRLRLRKNVHPPTHYPMLMRGYPLESRN